MCGILGYISKSKIDNDVFIDSLNTLTSRGPDDIGCVEKTIGNKFLMFGARRLSILDLSKKGKQPMTDETRRYTILHNAEIYNFQELKRKLEKKGYQFKSKTDTEVLLKGYIEYGLRVVDYIEGMFAFAIFDTKKGIITIARDHLGKKPLYYYQDSNCFVFASELKALRKFKGIKNKLTINPLSVQKYFYHGFIPSPLTIYNEIKKLEPATMFQFDLQKWSIVNYHSYWDIKTSLHITTDEDEIILKFDALFRKAIDKRLVSDVPLGLLLSGGLDSGLIAAIASRKVPNINTYTVGYEDYSYTKDIYYAKKISESLHIKNHSFIFEDRLVKKYFTDIMDYVDEPLNRPSIIPLYFLAKHVKKNTTVLLDGEGADELFGGYQKHVDFKQSKLQSILQLFSLKKRQNKEYSFISGKVFSENQLTNLFAIPIQSNDLIFQDVSKYERFFSQQDEVNKQLYIDSKIQTPDYLLSGNDLSTMAASVEIRSPFLDKELVEYIFSLEGRWKIYKGVQKYILRKYASTYLDNDIIQRQKDIFANIPINRWIRTVLKNIFKDVLLNENHYLNKETINHMFTNHINQKANYGYQLLRIFQFNYFIEKLK